jgi:N-acetylglutamate synthase-like GNAT family acetyltransferase
MIEDHGRFKSSNDQSEPASTSQQNRKSINVDIEIRPYELKDQQAVIDLILGIQQNEFGIPITLDDQPDLLTVKDFYQRDAGNFWVAEHHGKVVGTIALIDAGEGLGALRKMFVDPAYRGREFGIASQLLERLLAWATEHGLKEVYLGTTDKFHAAHRFYEKSGFTAVASEDVPAHFPRMKPDTHFYKIAL